MALHLGITPGGLGEPCGVLGMEPGSAECLAGPLCRLSSPPVTFLRSSSSCSRSVRSSSKMPFSSTRASLLSALS